MRIDLQKSSVSLLQNPRGLPLTTRPVRAFVVEIPAKLTSKALGYVPNHPHHAVVVILMSSRIVKPIIPSGGKHPSFSHLRRICTLTHLPIDLTWRRDYDSNGLQTSFLILPNTTVPWEDIKATLQPHIDVIGLPRCFDAVVPRFAPLNAEQASLWTERYWPTIYNPAAQVLQDAPPINQLRKIRTALEVPDTDKYMKLAIRAAEEAKAGGHGRAVGAVVVDPETGNVVAVAGDARWATVDATTREELKALNHEGRPEYHALMRVIAMVANKELGRRIKAGTHTRFLATCTETPSGQALTPIEQQYEDDDRVLQDITVGLGNVALTDPVSTDMPSKQSGPRNEGYLCSGLDVYLTHEPCVCCGMAMIHSRFRACVLGHRLKGSGSLTSEAGERNLAYGLFWRRELNWRVMTFQHTQASMLSGNGEIEAGIFHA